MANTIFKFGLSLSSLDFFNEASHNVELATVLRTDLQVHIVRQPLTERVDALLLSCAACGFQPLIGCARVQGYLVLVSEKPNVLFFAHALLAIDHTRDVTLVSVRVESDLDPQGSLMSLCRYLVIMKVHSLYLCCGPTALKQLFLLRGLRQGLVDDHLDFFQCFVQLLDFVIHVISNVAIFRKLPATE